MNKLQVLGAGLLCAFTAIALAVAPRPALGGLQQLTQLDAIAVTVYVGVTPAPTAPPTGVAASETVNLSLGATTAQYMQPSSKALSFAGSAGQTVAEACAEKIWLSPNQGTNASSIEIAMNSAFKNISGGSSSIPTTALEWAYASPSPPASPSPAYTPAVDFATDGNTLVLLGGTISNQAPICLNIEVKIPASTAAGIYAANLDLEYFTGLSGGASPSSPPSASPSPTSAPTAAPSAFFAAQFVGNQNYLLEFAIGGNGNVTPSTVISDPSGSPFFANPTDALLAPNGDIIASACNDLDGTLGQVWVFEEGASGISTPLATISDTLFNCPESVATDAASDIYVLQGVGNYWTTDAIMKFPIGSNGLSVNPEQGLPANGPSLQTADELLEPEDIASLSDGTLYVAQDAGVYTTAPSGILEFAPNANGPNAAPVGVITGSNTDVGYPGGVAVDGSGKIYVLTRDDTGPWPFLNVGTPMTNPRILVYAAGATGNVTPIATITSPDMTDPIRMRVDSAGDIYVADLAIGGILYFPAGSNGQNLTPTYIISGSNTTLGVNNVQFVGI